MLVASLADGGTKCMKDILGSAKALGDVRWTAGRGRWLAWALGVGYLGRQAAGRYLGRRGDAKDGIWFGQHQGGPRRSQEKGVRWSADWSIRKS
ncbi:unnamed protein product [Ilex paraguariensis]|uniref:Uncharacterized protein n=1 Tax=Ilex paraguariensis TaxID=185542 RepID=A0ABC8SWH3_9AQUA